jgi:hypothetical protein
MIIVIIYYLILLAIFIFASFWCWTLITDQQKYMNSAYNSIDDMSKCPNTAKYFTKFQTGFVCSYFAFLASSLTGCFMIFFFIGLSLFENTRPILNYSFVYLAIILLAVFISVYKISNCFLMRLCGMNSCISKYF